MEYSILSKNDITVIKLKGEIDVTVAAKLREVFKSKIDNGAIKIIVDLAEVKLIDSSGLGILIVAFKSVKSKGGDIKFVNAKSEVWKIIKLTKLDKHFELFKSPEQAVLSFQQ